MPNGTVIQHPQWPPRPVHPGPAPIHPPWHGGPWECSCGTDPCTCGCQPNWSQDAIRCWNEMQQFTEMLRQIIQCELARAPVGITGVVDGSDALPGQVGEFIRGGASLAYAAYPANTIGVVSPLVVPPGDWDLFGIATISAGIGTGGAYMVSPPAGVTDAMWVQEGVPGQATIGQMTFNTIRGNFTVPTLLSFHCTIDNSQDAGLTSAGQFTVIISGRRRR